jgi:hypothetical protein
MAICRTLTLTESDANGVGVFINVMPCKFPDCLDSVPTPQVAIPMNPRNGGGTATEPSKED